MGKKVTSNLNGDAAASDLNLILYGPPGTGKTYHTFSHAVRICDGKLPDTREAIVQRFKALREEGRIEVVTFHQSYAYEDFVEGIRPILESEGDGESAGRGQDIRYECRDGVFKRICDVARTKRVKQSTQFKPRRMPLR